MRRILLAVLTAALMACCSPLRPTRSYGVSDNVEHIVDSIQRADRIELPPQWTWLVTKMYTNEGSLESRFIYLENGRRKYYLSILIRQDGRCYYNYRVE